MTHSFATDPNTANAKHPTPIQISAIASKSRPPPLGVAMTTPGIDAVSVIVDGVVVVVVVVVVDTGSFSFVVDVVVAPVGATVINVVDDIVGEPTCVAELVGEPTCVAELVLEDDDVVAPVIVVLEDGAVASVVVVVVAIVVAIVVVDVVVVVGAAVVVVVVPAFVVIRLIANFRDKTRIDLQKQTRRSAQLRNTRTLRCAGQIKGNQCRIAKH